MVKQLLRFLKALAVTVVVSALPLHHLSVELFHRQLRLHPAHRVEVLLIAVAAAVAVAVVVEAVAGNILAINNKQLNYQL